MESYRFRMGQRVMDRTSRQSGRIVARAEWITGRKAYLLHFDNRLAGKNEHWRDETAVIEEE